MVLHAMFRIGQKHFQNATNWRGKEKKRVKHERKSEFLFSMISDFAIFHVSFMVFSACMCMQYRLQ